MQNITLNTQRLYVKNVSYESTDTPQSFREQGRPENSIEMRINRNNLAEENHHEVVLTLTVTTKIENKTLCTIKTEQAGVFKVEHANEEQLDQILNTYCPHVLYPYASNAISQLAVMGSLPAIILQPIDFNDLYKKRKDAEKEDLNDSKRTVH